MHMSLLKTFIGILGAVVLALSLGCGGEASDRPEDCRSGQYYDRAQRLCVTCPAVAEPTCMEGCGFRIRSDDRGCPVAQCAVDCDLCDEGQVFSNETLRCEPAS
ncbi:MAG: hypothetical protein ACNA8W_18865 [Bradymonadaceae bacterium]